MLFVGAKSTPRNYIRIKLWGYATLNRNDVIKNRQLSAVGLIVLSVIMLR